MTQEDTTESLDPTNEIVELEKMVKQAVRRIQTSTSLIPELATLNSDIHSFDQSSINHQVKHLPHNLYLADLNIEAPDLSP